MLIHEIENGHHRLIYKDGKQGEWTPYDQIAVLDDYYASTQHFPMFPQVFKIVEVDCEKAFLMHDSDDYWQGSK